MKGGSGADGLWILWKVWITLREICLGERKGAINSGKTKTGGGGAKKEDIHSFLTPGRGEKTVDMWKT